MIVARVVERLVSSEKHSLYEGAKLLWVEPVDLVGGGSLGSPFLAVDTVGAGSDETVLVTREGGASILAFRTPLAPIDAAVVGVVDDVQLDRAWLER